MFIQLYLYAFYVQVYFAKAFKVYQNEPCEYSAILQYF